MKIFDFFRKYMGKMVRAGAEIFDKLEPEPKFWTSWSRSQAAQKWTGSATLVLKRLAWYLSRIDALVMGARNRIKIFTRSRIKMTRLRNTDL
jgi:hypothetical protein